jgi:V-type H+-transporting ATPase subunit E
MMQGLLQMMEPEAVVHCRKKDKSATEKAAEGAASQYKEISGRTVKVSVRAELADDG